MPTPDVSEEIAGPVIAQLIAKEVERTQATTTSLQSRGLAVISSSGTLVTLLFGLSALATNASNFTLTASTKIPLILAAALLVLAAVAGIATNAPRQKHAIGLDGLAPLLEDEPWSARAKNALQATARAQLTIARAAREANRTTAHFLLAGIALEISGVACIAWAVIALIGAA
jgi:hypothetical protein